MPRRPRPQSFLGVDRHSQNLVARHRPDHVRVLVPNVCLDVRHELVVAVAAHDLTARTVDLFRHVAPFVVDLHRCYAASSSTPSAASASLAASCSAAFFYAPLPSPSCSPSTATAHVKRRSGGGPSTSSPREDNPASRRSPAHR